MQIMELAAASFMSKGHTDVNGSELSGSGSEIPDSRECKVDGVKNLEVQADHQLPSCPQQQQAPTLLDGSPHASEPFNSSHKDAASSAAEPADEAAVATTPSTSIFFARAPSTMPYEDLLMLFSQFGSVQHLNLFKRWPKAKTSKGCGIVQYSSVQEASTALSTLNGIHSFGNYPGCEGTMVVEWVDERRSNATRSSLTAPHKKKSSKDQSLSTFHSSSWCGSLTSSSSNQQRQPLQQQQQLLLPVSRDPAAPATATATATACCDPFVPSVGSVHPVLNLDVSNLLSCSVDDGLGVLGGTTEGLTGVTHNLGAGIPMHELPMMIANQVNAGLHSAPLPQLNPLLLVPPAAAATAAMTAAVPGASQISLVAPSLASAGLELLPVPTPSAVLGGLNNNLPSSLQPLMPSSLAPRTQQQQSIGNNSSSLTAPIESSALVVAQQQQQQLLQAGITCHTTLTSNVNRSDTSSNAGTSALLQRPAMGGNIGIAPSPPAQAATVPGQTDRTLLLGSSSSSTSTSLWPSLSPGTGGSMAPPHAVPAAAAATAATAVPQVLDGCVPTVPSRMPYQSQQLQRPAGSDGNTTIRLELSDYSLSQLLPHIAAVARLSGAEV